MNRSTIVLLVGFAALSAIAGGYGIKPGLWETKIVKQVVDGKDMSAQMTAMASQMQQMMANMPPEQRAKMEEAMKGRGGPKFGDNGTVRLCITPEQANSDRPMVDSRGGCDPATVNRSGNHVSFELHCNSNGSVTTGKGESTITGDLVATSIDMTTKSSDGKTHVMHNESVMNFVGSDCGDVKPVQRPKSP